ncbi:MAG: HutD family protein [Micrococcales bacterium]|nr:HutD family protein [Micrococcales bacterium]
MAPTASALGLVPRAEQGVTAWRNGGGVTRALATCRRGGEVLWRVSIAHIDRDGVFSPFPGLDRRLTLVAGHTLALTIDGHEYLVRCGCSIDFSGDADVSCTVPGGPVEALNVMTRRGTPPRIPVDVPLDGTRGVRVAAGDLALLVSGATTVTVPGGAGARHRMGALDALVPAAGADRWVTGAGRLLVVHC